MPFPPEAAAPFDSTPLDPVPFDRVEHSGDHLVADLRMAVMRLRRRLVHERHPDNSLSVGQMTILALLARHGDQSMRSLAEFERVRPPSMTRIVNDLEAAGHVVRTGHPEDGRVALVRLTDSGRAVVAADRVRRDEWLSARLGALGASDRAAVEAALPALLRLTQEG